MRSNVGSSFPSMNRATWTCRVNAAAPTSSSSSKLARFQWARDLRVFDTRTITLERDAKGNWNVDGARASALKGCTDIDLGCSPSTNTLPIRRLRLAIDSSRTIQAAWIQFPELTVVKAAQKYTRLDDYTYRYASGDFEAELTVDDDGLVASYAEWQRTGFAMGPDATGPLDEYR